MRAATMNAQIRTKPDDTRERIMETAEALFRRMGFAKTAVADIAAELRMSPAKPRASAFAPSIARANMCFSFRTAAC